MSGYGPGPVWQQLPAGTPEEAAAARDGLQAGAVDIPVVAGPGAQLMAERRAQGLSLGDIARQLKLSVRQVEALERDDYQAFAGMVFVRGFLRNYAKLLQLDPEPLVAMTVSETAQAQAAPAAAPTRDERTPWLMLPGRGWLLAGVVLTALVVAAILESRRNQGPAPAPGLPPAPLATSPPPTRPEPTTAAPATPSAPSPAAAPSAVTPVAPAAEADAAAPAAPVEPATAVASTAPAPEASNTGTPAPPPAAAPTGAEQQVKLVFEGPAWVEIKDGSGAVIFSQLSDTGVERTVTGRPPLALVIGNAHAVRLSFRDRPVDLAPHTRVDVARLVLE